MTDLRFDDLLDGFVLPRHRNPSFFGIPGEGMCTWLLVAGATFAFTCWKEPIIFLQTAASDGIIISSCDSSIGEHRDEAIELQQSSS